MILKVTIADQLLELNVPDALLEQAREFFDKMDADMNQGWQVNRDWVDQPDTYLRGQIAANKLLTAIENRDDNLGRLMAGYILSRFPDIELVELSEQGEIRDHVLNMKAGAGHAEDGPSLSFSHGGLPHGLSKMDAMTQAGKDVSGVFKMGRQYRFSVFNHATGEWDQSPAFASKEDAEAAREKVFKQRFDALCQAPQIH